ncbi:MAG: hypothetical protein ACP5I7_03920 [Sulfolobales archaeon]|jgi:hypothetical protein
MLRLKNCSNCIYWRPLQHHPTLGACVASNNKITNKYDSCDKYARLNLSYYDFMWCLDCGTYIYKDDYDLHIGHSLYPEPYVDPDSHEETYVAD